MFYRFECHTFRGEMSISHQEEAESRKRFTTQPSNN